MSVSATMWSYPYQQQTKYIELEDGVCPCTAHCLSPCWFVFQISVGPGLPQILVWSLVLPGLSHSAWNMVEGWLTAGSSLAYLCSLLHYELIDGCLLLNWPLYMGHQNWSSDLGEWGNLLRDKGPFYIYDFLIFFKSWSNNSLLLWLFSF